MKLGCTVVYNEIMWLGDALKGAKIPIRLNSNCWLFFWFKQNPRVYDFSFSNIYICLFFLWKLTYERKVFELFVFYLVGTRIFTFFLSNFFGLMTLNQMKSISKSTRRPTFINSKSPIALTSTWPQTVSRKRECKKIG
jgi:hypothetical protein